jgi:hypothetical protein
MNFVNQRTIYSGVFYLLVVALIFVAKPPLMFDRDGEFKNFGIGSQKTLFSFGVLVVTIAMLSFYVFAMIDLIFQK